MIAIMKQKMVRGLTYPVPSAKRICVVIVMTWNVRNVNVDARARDQKAKFFQEQGYGHVRGKELIGNCLSCSII